MVYGLIAKDVQQNFACGERFARRPSIYPETVTLLMLNMKWLASFLSNNREQKWHALHYDSIIHSSTLVVYHFYLILEVGLHFQHVFSSRFALPALINSFNKFSISLPY